MIIRVNLLCVAVACIACCAAGPPPATLPTTGPATRPAARPDPAMWVRRNLDLIREAAGRKAGPGEAGGIGSALSFSLFGNRLLARDPYAGELVKIVDAAAAKRGDDPNLRTMLESAKAWLRLPEEQRVLRQFLQKNDANKPLMEPGEMPYGVALSLCHAPPGEPYDTYVAHAVDQMDAAARKAGNFGGLALGYLALAEDALEARGRTDARAKLYTDRMLALLREHPTFQDLRRGNSDAPEPARVVKLLTDAGRKNDVDDLIKKLDGPLKIDLLLGVIEAHAGAGDLEAAQRVVEDEIRPRDPTPARRLKAALAGRVEPLPAAATRPTITRVDRVGKKHTIRGQLDSREMRMRNVLTAVAHAHARRGEVDLAAKQWIALHADDVSHTAGEGNLQSYEWASLARDAWEGGHADAARKAYEHALPALARDPVPPPGGTDDKAAVLREALDVGGERLVFRMLQSTGGAWDRQLLADAYRRRGDVARANELTDEAVRDAREERGGGSAMAKIAVDLHAAGDTRRAETLLLESLDHIAGEDFGFGGTADVVAAAARMNRLDLLDRLYDKGTAEQKLLLCITATNMGMDPRALEEGEK